MKKNLTPFQRILRSLMTLLAQMVPVVVFICAAIQAVPVAAAKSPSCPLVSPAWPVATVASDTTARTLREVVLYPLESVNGYESSIFADLVFVNGRYCISYEINPQKQSI